MVGADHRGGIERRHMEKHKEEYVVKDHTTPEARITKNRIKYGMISNEKTVKKAMFFSEENSMGTDKLEMTVSASGKNAGRLMEMAEEMMDSFFREVQKELKKGTLEEPSSKKRVIDGEIVCDTVQRSIYDMVSKELTHDIYHGLIEGR